jgi:shikimate kinase
MINWNLKGYFMGKGIIVCGCNGSGKSTLGKELARKLKYTFLDIEDYYFPNKSTDYTYDFPRSRKEVESLLLDDMKKCNNFVLASVKGNFGKEIVSLFTTAVIINVLKEIRLQRVKSRSFQKFGNRILPSGDLYEKEKQFFDMVASRTELIVEEWLHSTNCSVVRIDGTKPIVENVEQITNELFGK